MDETVRLSRFAGPLLFVVGVAALAVGFLQNEATLSLFVIFPVITATGVWAFLGIILMMAGVFVFFLTLGGTVEPSPVAVPTGPPTPLAPATTSPSAAQRRWGGIVFLGPIPVVFGSDLKVTKWMLLVGILLFVALVVLTVIALRSV